MILKKIKHLTLLILVLLLGVGFIISAYGLMQAFFSTQAGGYEWLKSLLYEEQKDFFPLFTEIISIVLFSSFTFLFLLLFSSGLSLLFLDRPEGFKRVFIWQLYKYAHALLPAIVVNVVAIGVLILSILFFNAIMSISGVSIGMVTFISTFVGFNIVFFFIFTAIFSAWQLVKLSFGTELVLSKPELDFSTIAAKSKRLGVNLPVLSIYLLFIAFLVMQLVKINEPALLPLLFLNILSYTGIKYLKTSAYKKSRV